MKMSDALDDLATALASFQGEAEAVSKDGDNPFYKSKYASLPNVVKSAAPLLAKHGLSVSQFLGHDELGDTLTTILLHSSGQYIADTMHLRPVKDDPQAQGSATTYGRRYAYMAATGLVADEDDDGNHASAATAPPTAHSDSHGGPKITEAQRTKFIVPLKNRMKMPEPLFRTILKEDFGVTDLRALPIGRVEELAERLKAWKPREVEAPTATPDVPPDTDGLAEQVAVQFDAQDVPFN